MGPLNQVSGCPPERLCSCIRLEQLAQPWTFLDGMCVRRWLYFPGATEFVTPFYLFIFFLPFLGGWGEGNLGDVSTFLSKWKLWSCPVSFKSLSLKGCAAPKGRKDLVRNHRAINGWIKYCLVGNPLHSTSVGAVQRGKHTATFSYDHNEPKPNAIFLCVCVCVWVRERERKCELFICVLCCQFISSGKNTV